MTGLAGIDMRPVITLKCVKPLGHELWRVTHVTACEHKKHTNASYAIGFICEKKPHYSGRRWLIKVYMEKCC